jgi:hypothetical protein
MTESPIAVTCRPETFGSFAGAIRHADAGTGEADAGDADADGLTGTAPEPAPWELAWAEA